MLSPGCSFPGCIVNLSMIPGYTAVNDFMATDMAPLNMNIEETANLGLNSSDVGAPTPKSGDLWFKSRSRKLVFVLPLSCVQIMPAGRPSSFVKM